VRHAIRYYETTTFFGHESDADIEITPAMALIMPSWPWTWTGTGFGEPQARSVVEAIVLETSAAAEAAAEEHRPELELGPAGAPHAAAAEQAEQAGEGQ